LLLAGPGDQIVQEPADLADVARDFRNAFLGVIQFFQDHHRQVKFLKAEQRGGIVHQDVGVEYEQTSVG